jgi:hypothetical protein
VVVPSTVPRESRRAPKRTLPIAPRQRWTPALLSAVAAGERKVLAPLLAEGREGAAIEAAEIAFTRAAELARAAIASDPPPEPIACRDRCSFCCMAKVVVTAPEILRVVAHLRRTLAPEAFAALLERVRTADATTRGLSRAARLPARVPCPLLLEGSCSVYPVRPLVCAGWNSLDQGACERYFAAPEGQPSAPAFAPAYEVTSAVLAGLGGACFDAGLDGSLLELIAALRIAMERPSAEERWRRRLPVFALARDMEPGGPPEA